MNNTFKDLEKYKQEKILNTAFEEFAQHGYKKASTNRIVEGAGISKGMLFYYFNSKKELYHDLVDYGIDLIKKKYLGLISGEETDFIEKYRHASVLKLKAYHENPHVFHFLSRVYLNPEESVLDEEALAKILEIKDLTYSKFYTHIDESLFRDGVPKERICQMIQWSMEGYEKELMEELKRVPLAEIDYEPYWDSFYEYLDILKVIFYK